MIICCGLLTVDVIQTIERLPRADEKIVAQRLVVDFGGPAANAAAVAAALGSSVKLVAAVGNGPLAEVAKTKLDGSGVRLHDLASTGDPAVSTVLVTQGTGERAVVSTNATAVLPDAVSVESILTDFGRGDVLLVDGHLMEVALPLAQAARARGGTVVMDGGSWKPGTRDLMATCDVVVVSADFTLDAAAVERADGDARPLLDVLATWGPRTVGQTAGAGAVEVRAGGQPFSVPVPPADRVVDTLGAGDVLHGALAAYCDQGFEDIAAITRATRVATDSVRFVGARGWVDES